MHEYMNTRMCIGMRIGMCIYMYMFLPMRVYTYTYVGICMCICLYSTGRHVFSSLVRTCRDLSITVHQYGYERWTCP